MSGYWLSKLTLTHFRNYGAASLTLDQRPVVLCGENGAGKTNILEGISLLSPGRGLRRAAYSDMTQSGATAPWSVFATVETPTGPVAIGTGPKPDSGPDAQTRVVRIDQQPASTISALSDHVRVLWLTPAMDGLFTGPAGDRRRFLDRLVLAVDPGHGSQVNAFERAMRDRNRLNADAGADPAWLDALEDRMAETGTAIAAGRMDAVARLTDAIAEARREGIDDVFPWSGLALSGWLESRLENMAAVEVEDQYRAMLRESRISDRQAGRTLTGPHRSDLNVSHGPKAIAARLASTGEQKALLIGLILAHARLVATSLGGAAPILLLDEIAAHLDEGRRAALFDRVIGLGGQAWMTGTDREVFAPIEDRALTARVTSGTVEFLD